MSEGVIGLLLSVGMDNKPAQAALAELRASTVAETGEISNIWSSALNAITGPTAIAVGGIVGIGGAMLEAANKAAEMGNQIYEASEKTGMSAETLSGLAAVSKETGKSFESLSSAFARGALNIAKAADSGKGKLAELFTTAQLESLKLKPVDEQMHVVLQRIFALNNVGERNLALQALMGRGWQENVGILKMLATEGYGPAIEQAKKLHIYYDDKAAQQAHTYGIEMRQLQGEISGLGLAIGRELLPHLTEWLAELHTVNYEVQLLEIGLKAQALSLINVGGIFDKQLDALAAKATDVFMAEHAALQKFKQEIEDMGKGAEGANLLGAGAGAGEGAAKQTKAVQGLNDAYSKTNIVLPPVIQAMLRIEKSRADAAIRAQAEALLDYGKAIDAPVLKMPQFNAALAQTPSWLQKIPPYVEQNTSALQRFAVAMHTAAKAMESDTAAQGELFAKGLAGLIGGRKAQAGVEALWETARGIACLAEGAWPPNPAAILAAGLHFEAAAQYAVMAGTSSRRGGAGAGAGSYGGSREDYSRGGGDSRGAYAPPQTLAPGAGGGGGRFGPGSGLVMVFGGPDVHAWMAKTVTEAANQGHTVISTSSQRGAPVGH